MICKNGEVLDYEELSDYFLELEAERDRLKKAIQTADPIELGKIKKELDNE